MRPFFSIVVSCRNVASHVQECLASLQKQSFGDWECLVLVEKSDDDTEKNVREQVSSDFHFRVFSLPDSGSYATPRNVGTDNAQGEYVIYLDGSDSLADNALERLVREMEERPDADIYACAILEYGKGPIPFRTIDNFTKDAPADLSGHDAILLLYRHWRHPSPIVQENIWKRDFLNANKLRFIPGLRHENHEFFPRALYLAHRIVPLHEPFCLYRRPDALQSGWNNEPGFFLKHMNVVIKSLLAFHASVSAERGFDQRIAHCWAREWISWLFDWFYKWNVGKIPRERRRETLKVIFKDGFGDLDALMKHATLQRRIAVWWVKSFVKHPSCSGMAEMFFRLYFLFADMKNKAISQGLHIHGED